MVEEAVRLLTRWLTLQPPTPDRVEFRARVIHDVLPLMPAVLNSHQPSPRLLAMSIVLLGTMVSTIRGTAVIGFTVVTHYLRNEPEVVMSVSHSVFH